MADGQIHIPKLLDRGVVWVADQADQNLGAALAGCADRGARGGKGRAADIIVEIAELVIMADDRNIATHAQATLTRGAAHPDGKDHR